MVLACARPIAPRNRLANSLAFVDIINMPVVTAQAQPPPPPAQPTANTLPANPRFGANLLGSNNSETIAPRLG